MPSLAQRFATVRDRAKADYLAAVEAEGGSLRGNITRSINAAGADLHAQVGGTVDTLSAAFPELDGWGAVLNKPADAIAGILPALGPVGAALEGAASAVVAAWAAGEVAVDIANWARRNIQDTGPELEARVAWTKNQANVFLLYGSIFGVPDRIRERSTREAKAWLVRSSQKGDGAWPILVRADRSERLANAWYDVNYPIIQTLRAGMVEKALQARYDPSLVSSASAWVGFTPETEACDVVNPASCSLTTLRALAGQWRSFFAASAYVTAIEFSQGASLRQAAAAGTPAAGAELTAGIYGGLKGAGIVRPWFQIAMEHNASKGERAQGQLNAGALAMLAIAAKYLR